jgi:hypothetical protein
VVDLTGSFLKLRRAYQHIDSLRAAAKVAYHIVPEEYEERRRLRLRFGPAHFEVPLIFGDVVHNLRAALDHLAWEAADRTLRDWRTEFPVIRIGAKGPDDMEAFAKTKMQGAAQSVIGLVAECEPYQGGGGHAIWQLHELDIIDKHRKMVVTVSQSDSMSPDFGGIAEQSNIDPKFVDAFKSVRVWIKSAEPTELHDGEILAEHPLDQPVGNPQYAIRVTVDEPPVVESEPILELAANLSQAVETMLDKVRDL